MSADVPPPVTSPVTPESGGVRVVAGPSPAGLPVTGSGQVPVHARRSQPGAGWLLASRVILGVAAAVTLMVAALAAGSRYDDGQIDGHLGTATATVLSISSLNTGIEFVDAGGVTIRPPTGVLYPGLLAVGERFEVEYSTIDPTVVRVAGRTAAVGNVVQGATLAVTWLLAASANFLLRRRLGAVGRKERQGSSAFSPIP